MTPIKWFGKKIIYKKFLILGLLFVGTFLLIVAINMINWNVLFQPLTNLIFMMEVHYEQWLTKQTNNNFTFLIVVAFLGGLISSISPCKLSLLSVNLSYIGTREITSKWDAFIKAGSFVLGVVTILSLLGLFSSFAGAVMVEFRGYINVIVGTIIILVGLNFVNIIRLPLPQTNFKLPFAGAYSLGLTFALVSSPCSSPVLFSILAVAGTTGSQIQSILTMISYALGNTIIIFIASLFTGFAKQTRFLLPYSDLILRLGGAMLIFIGGYYVTNGTQWLFLVINNG